MEQIQVREGERRHEKKKFVNHSRSPGQRELSWCPALRELDLTKT